MRDCTAVATRSRYRCKFFLSKMCFSINTIHRVVGECRLPIMYWGCSKTGVSTAQPKVSLSSAARSNAMLNYSAGFCPTPVRHSTCQYRIYPVGRTAKKKENSANSKKMSYSPDAAQRNPGAPIRAQRMLQYLLG
jgi:hypothetical protein